jgi:hypothetical protein
MITILGVFWALATQPACTIENLAFMQGDWRSTNGEERWVVTAAGTLSGSAYETKGTSVSFAEALSIAPQGDRIEMHLRHFDGALMHAWEDKDAPMVFALARCDGDTAVFDGTGAKIGEHITYRKAPDGLTFVGDFLHQGKPVHFEIAMHKAQP